MEDTSKDYKQVTVIVQDGCTPCHRTLDYLKWKGIKHDAVWLGQDMDWKLFSKLYPKSAGTPHCLVDGDEIPDLIAYFESGLEL